MDIEVTFEKSQGNQVFTGWNLYFILIYFLNMVNLERSGTGSLGEFAPAALMAFQIVLVSVLVYTNGMKRSLATLGIAEVPFKITQIIDGSLLDGNFTFIIVMFISLALAFTGLYRGRDVLERRGTVLKFVVLPVLIALSFMVLPVSGALYLHFDVVWTFLILFTFPITVLVIDLVFNRIIGKERILYNPGLTHHMIEESDHTIAATLGNFTIFFCTRCTGMILGVLFSVYTIITFKIEFNSLTALLLDIFIPMPVFIDWGSQRFGLRTSSTTSRIITGGLTGFGFYLITFSTIDYPIGSSIILGTYFVIFFLIYLISNRRYYYEDEDDF
ncbi:MAG: DUF2085 domain-containing protein [Promethearchaeota archaeon]